MSVLKASFVIGGAIIVAAAIGNLDTLSELSTNGNVLRLDSGSAKLGTVYEEQLVTDYEIVDTTSNETLLSVSNRTSQIFDKAYDKFKENIDSANKLGGIKGDNGKLEQLDINKATYKNDVKIKKITNIVYRSKYSNAFTLNIDESTDFVSANSKPVVGIINDLKDYSKKMDELFRTKHDLIK
jgi:hypothetical protein